MAHTAIQRFRNGFALAIIVIGVFAGSNSSYSQSTEDQFHDLFITAGYASAFGAALGAAALSFQQRPESHLRYVAVGASMGFIGGSILGSYLAFSPVFTYADNLQKIEGMMIVEHPHSVVIQPVFHANSKKLVQIQSQIRLARF